uniref:Gremlin 2, DAN family BMP antagonist n=1 Tax=Falco tinnunculus TaxID=100819 RepID=A0A8C4VAM3_FALTI
MIWKFALSVFLMAALVRVTDTRKNRPAGAIPSPYKDSSSNHSERRQQLNKEVLASSQEALVVTERKYLKSDWCKTQPLRQTVSEEGCISRTIINRFCYGQCNSFYIPRHVKKEEESFQSCAFCKPHKVTSSTVQLECPELDPPFRLKKIQKEASLEQGEAPCRLPTGITLFNGLCEALHHQVSLYFQCHLAVESAGVEQAARSCDRSSK